MDIARTIEHFGAHIQFVNLKGKDLADMLARIAAMKEAIAKHPPGSALVLTDAGGSHLDDEVRKALTEAMAANAPFVKASAVVGLSPKRQETTQLLESMAGRNDIRFFDAVEPALDWLAEQGRGAGGAV